jgi:hypothetical protein
MNRFSGFAPVLETAEAVRRPHAAPSTPLKRGVNENVANMRELPATGSL